MNRPLLSFDLLKKGFLTVTIWVIFTEFLGVFYNISIYLSRDIAPNLTRQWINLNARNVSFLSSYIPAFQHLSSEMKSRGYSENIPFFREVVASNISIILTSFIVEVFIIFGIRVISDETIGKNFFLSMKVFFEKRKKTMSIVKARIYIIILFILINFMIFNGNLYLSPDSLYRNDSSVAMIAVTTFTAIVINHLFVVFFVCTPIFHQQSE